MFARAMNSSADGTVRAAPDLRADVAALAGVLVGEVEALGSPQGGAATLAGHELWLGAEEVEALTAAVRPKQAALRKALEELLFEVVALQARPGRPDGGLGLRARAAPEGVGRRTCELGAVCQRRSCKLGENALHRDV
jgi:hypothetical protein